MTFFKDEVARTGLAQHMRDCETARAEDRRDQELRAAEIARNLETQNTRTEEMHKQNLANFTKLNDLASARVNRLQWWVITTLSSVVVALVVEIVKAVHTG
jgi:hypothetical protein